MLTESDLVALLGILNDDVRMPPPSVVLCIYTTVHHTMEGALRRGAVRGGRGKSQVGHDFRPLS
jgi:hypothetical protein